MKENTKVPGPGAYNSIESKANLETVKTLRFGTGSRTSIENPNSKKFPGPGQHSPDFIRFKSSAPQFGFGSEIRESPGSGKKNFSPGPGNY